MYTVSHLPRDVEGFTGKQQFVPNPLGAIIVPVLQMNRGLLRQTATLKVRELVSGPHRVLSLALHDLEASPASLWGKE